MKSKVAVIKTSPGTVIEDYGRLMRLAGYGDLITPDKKTYLKVNLSWREWFPAASTEPWQLEGTARALLDDGFTAESISAAESRAIAVNAGAAEAFNGLRTAAERTGIDFIRLDENPVAWVPFTPKAHLLALDRFTGEIGIMLPDIFLGNNVIHLPTMKTHVETRVAGAAMSAFDALLDGEGWGQSDIHELLVDVLTIQKEAYGGVFTVMDGALAGDGPGPRTLVPYEKDYLLAGADQVAVDAVAAHMMGFDPMRIRYIRLATEHGVGQGDISKIEFAGDDVSEVNFHFSGGKRPLVPPAGAYLEYYWYPFKGWPHVGRIAETAWGQLFQEYLPEGAELERQGKGKGPLLALAAAAALLGMSAARRVARLAGR